MDASGSAVDGARLVVRPRASLYRALGIPADDLPPIWSATAGTDGRFEIRDAAGGEHFALHVSCVGYEQSELSVPDRDESSLVVEIEALEGAYVLRGVVLDPAGFPLPGAWVSAGIETVMSREDGSFAVTWDPDRRRGAMYVAGADGTLRPRADQRHLAAVRDGYAPARLELSADVAGRPIELRLGERALEIVGLVVDETGSPLEGAVVWITDPTHFGQTTWFTLDGELQTDSTVEFVGTRRPGGVQTDTDGRFRFWRLLDRSYTLAAYDPRTASHGPGLQVAAGAPDVRLVLERDPSLARVAGRIVSTSGEPLAGVRVVPARPAPPEGRPPQGFRSGEPTDAQGRFAFESLATAGTRLQLDGGALLWPRSVDLADFDDLSRIEVEVPRACELLVELADPAAADRIELLGPDGEPLRLCEAQVGAVSLAPWAGLVEGRTSVLAVDETARTLVLLCGDEEVRRVPVHLDPDERTIVRL